MKKILAVLIAVALMFPVTAVAKEIFVEWPAGAEIDLVSYKVLGAPTSAGPFTEIGSVTHVSGQAMFSLSVGNTPFPAGSNRCWVVAALDSFGQESTPSDVVCLPAPPEKLGTPRIVSR